MEAKKKSSVNLQGNRTLYVLLGINVCLLLTWAALQYSTPIEEEKEEEKEVAVVFADDIPVVEVEDVAPPPPPPPDAPPPPPPPPEVITEIEETDTPPPPPPPEQPKVITPKTNIPTKIKLPTKAAPAKLPTKKPEKKEDRRKKRVSAREVDIMAVYPGCEKDRDVRKAAGAEAKKKALNKCFGKRLKSDLEDQLDIEYLTEEAQDNDELNMVAKLDFVVDEKGRIIEVRPKSKGSATLKPEAVKALQRVAKRIERKGGIQPAKYSDGTEVQMKYSIPVRFRLAN